MKNNMYNVKPNLKLTPIEATAVAWAIASEGNISLHLCRSTDLVYNRCYESIQPIIAIGNTKFEFLKILQDYVGGSLAPAKTIWPQKPAWRLLICGTKDVYTLLKQIEPYLPIKKEQARLVMEFCTLKMNKTRINEKLTPNHERIREIYAEMKQLNKRGLRP